MESKYLLEIDDSRRSTRYFSDDQREAADQASLRLQRKCIEGRPFVAIHIKNPRYSVKD